MYWLCFFITFIALGVSALVWYNILEKEEFQSGHIILYIAAIVIIAALSAAWPLVWTLLALGAVIYFSFNFIKKFIGKYTKEKN